MSVTVDLAIEDPSWTVLGDLQALAERAVDAALAEAGVSPKYDTELSCLFCDDAAIRRLNAQWRGIDKPTNVLSFPAAGPGAGRLLGDVALAYETVAREAAAHGKRVEDHVTHLIVHGVLHLAGHDHELDDEAATMEKLETLAMRRLGLADPYAEPAAAERNVPGLARP